MFGVGIKETFLALLVLLIGLRSSRDSALVKEHGIDVMSEPLNEYTERKSGNCNWL